MEDRIDYNALGQAIDTSWGRSSTPKTASYSVKLTLQGSSAILLSYGAIVNFSSERQMIDMKRQYAEEANRVTVEIAKRIKLIYKDLTGNSLTIKPNLTSLNDSIEITTSASYSPTRTAYYKRNILLDIAL